MITNPAEQMQTGMKYGKKLRLDRRYKPRRFFRITWDAKIQFSDGRDGALGFIGLTKDLCCLFPNEPTLQEYEDCQGI